MNEYYADTRKRFQEQKVARGYEKRRYGTLKGKFLKYREEKIVKSILDGIENRSKIVDVPCGTGRFAPVLKEYASVLAGADISKAMLEQSKNKKQYTELHHCEIEAMPFGDNAFDVVACFRLIHHLPKEDRIKAFSEICRVTRKHFIFSFNNKKTVAYVVNNVVLKKEFYSETVKTIEEELDSYFMIKKVFHVLPFLAGETIVFCEKKLNG